MFDWLRINRPCDQDWDSMKGDDKSRYCLRCERMVYNLSAMTEAEADAVVCGSTTSSLPCVRFSRMSDGRVRTTDRAPLPRLALTGGLFAAAAATAALSSREPAPEDPGAWLWSRVGGDAPLEPLMGEPAEIPAGNIPEIGHTAQPPKEYQELGKPAPDYPMIQGRIAPMPEHVRMGRVAPSK